MSGRPEGDHGNAPDAGAMPGRKMDAQQTDSSDMELLKRLQDLGQRIEAEKIEERSQTTVARERDMTGFGKAMRLSADFIAGVVVGAGLGWALDKWLGTTPWGMIVLLLLGFCAGVLNVMRTAGLAPQPGETGWQPKGTPPQS